MAQNAATPPHPFSADSIVDNNVRFTSHYEGVADILKLSEGFDAVIHPQSQFDHEELEAWYKDALIKEKKIEDHTKDTRRKLRNMLREQEGRIREAREIDDSTDSALSRSEDLRDDHRSAASFLIERFRVIISVLRTACGDSVVKDIVVAELGGVDSFRELPAEVIASLKEFLSGAKEITAWNIASTCLLIENTGLEIKAAREEIELLNSKQRETDLKPVAPISLPVDRAKKLMEDIENSQRDVSPSLEDSTHDSSALTARNRRLRSVTPNPLSQANPEPHPATVDDDDDVEAPDVVALEASLISANQVNQNLRYELGKTKLEVQKLEGTLLHNFVFNQQLPATEVAALERGIDSIQIGTNGKTPFLHAAQALTLADQFPDKTSTPHTTDTTLYLQAVFHAVGGNDVKPTQTTMQRKQMQKHLLWLGTMMVDVTISASHEDVRLLMKILSTAINRVRPQGLARAALFVIVANFAQRLDDPSEEGLLMELITQVMTGSFGQPYGTQTYVDWDLLDRICFCWLLSSGPDVKLDYLKLSDMQKETFQVVCSGLRTNVPRDFIALLAHESIQKLIDVEQGASELLNFQESGSVKMTILRTGTCTKDTDKEYIWTRFGGKVSFSDRGILVKLRWNTETEKLDILIRARFADGDMTGPWFKVDSNNDKQSKYMDSYYVDVIEKAIEVYSSTKEHASRKK